MQLSTRIHAKFHLSITKSLEGKSRMDGHGLRNTKTYYIVSAESQEKIFKVTNFSLMQITISHLIILLCLDNF